VNAKKVGGDVELLTRVMRGSGEFSDEEWLAAKRLFSLRELQKGDHLLRAGEHAQWSVVVIQGLLREYYASPDGSEYTRTFIAREQLSGSLYDLLSNKPSITNIEALE
jgi:CRP-like cAMP-binding protein